MLKFIPILALASTLAAASPNGGKALLRANGNIETITITPGGQHIITL